MRNKIDDWCCCCRSHSTIDEEDSIFLACRTCRDSWSCPFIERIRERAKKKWILMTIYVDSKLSSWNWKSMKSNLLYCKQRCIHLVYIWMSWVRSLDETREHKRAHLMSVGSLSRGLIWWDVRGVFWSPLVELSYSLLTMTNIQYYRIYKILFVNWTTRLCFSPSAQSRWKLHVHIIRWMKSEWKFKSAENVGRDFHFLPPP